MSDIHDALQQQLGPTYTIERELGGGGMSRVFVAYDHALGRRIAVKVVAPELAAAVHLERFTREIMVVATLQNPHIVGVLAAGEVDGLPYFTMPFIEGESLRAHMLASGPMPVAEVVTVLRDVARALSYAHARGIVHRDIKPDNVLLASGSAMVTDFGIAKAVLSAQRTPSGERSAMLTQMGTTVGTPAYMAPEQIAADPTVDARADIYSLGVMAYEMLSGGAPFASLTPQALLAAHLTKAPRPLNEVRPGLPPRLVALIMQCMEKERARRPQSAGEIVAALDDPAIISTEALPAMRRRMPMSRRVLLALVAALLIIAGSVATYAATHTGTSTADSLATNPDSLAAHSLLVVPFVNLSADTSDKYLADGITSELVTALLRIPGLRVAAQLSSASGNEAYKTEHDLGITYKVGYVLEGTVQRDDSRLRITARLVNTADGFTAWSRVFDNTMQDVFAVQQDIATSISTELAPRLAARTPQVVAERGTADDTAYEAFTRAAGFISHGDPRGLHRAIGTLNRAIERDSSFARAYAAAAHAWSLLPTIDRGPADSAISHGITLATRAIALDSTLGEAYAARARLNTFAFHWANAERDYRKAISLNERDAATHRGLGENLLVQGRVRPALFELSQAEQLDPTSAATLSSIAIALATAGNDSAALRTAREALALDSSVVAPQLALATVQIYTGHPDSALSLLESAAALGRRGEPVPSSVPALLAYAYARVGDATHAATIVRQATNTTGPDGRGPGGPGPDMRNPDAQMIAAFAALGAGNTAGALNALTAAAADHAPLLGVQSLAAPIFDPVRSSPGFAALLRTLGLSSTLASSDR